MLAAERWSESGTNMPTRRAYARYRAPSALATRSRSSRRAASQYMKIAAPTTGATHALQEATNPPASARR